MRDWLYVEDHCRRHPAGPAARPSPARSTTSAAATSAPTSRSWTPCASELERRSRPPENPALRARGRATELKTFVTDRPGHDRRYAIDAARSAASSAGGRPRPRAGLAATVRWYLEHRDWCEAVQSGQLPARAPGPQRRAERSAGAPHIRDVPGSGPSRIRGPHDWGTRDAPAPTLISRRTENLAGPQCCSRRSNGARAGRSLPASCRTASGAPSGSRIPMPRDFAARRRRLSISPQPPTVSPLDFRSQMRVWHRRLGREA